MARQRTLLTQAALLTLVACGPSMTADPPATSAASERATAGPIASVATALHGDPPLPGEPSGAWVGLGNASSDGMAHHHHMDGMNMDMNMPGMDTKDGGRDAP